VSRAAFVIAPCPTGEAERLAEALGLHLPTAETLVRRGYADPAAARAFLEADGPQHDPFALGDMEAACERIEAAISSGGRIVVHGDYDVDGICATALAVETLRDLGANVAWHLPSRFAEGYGVALETVDALADAGAALLLTVDCGISAADAVARARARGLDVVVSDHHRPGEVWPDAPVVAARGPHERRYPDGELCGTGVVFKLAQALYARRQGGAPEAVTPALAAGLDLVALATVADVVPLSGENRALVRAGLRRLARGTRPGLTALMRSASVDRARLRASDCSFRLAPRLNAAGRLGHPGVALELLLTRDVAAAEEGARTLEALNRERQGIEEGILRAAVARVEAAPEAERRARALVVWGEGWHEGVIGIVASRLVERYGRPALVIAVDGETARGSGRSIPAFDLHAGLTTCARHLQRYGGHPAAAGLTAAAGDLPALAEAFRAHADGVLGDDDLHRPQRVDAILALGDVSVELARELGRLEPCGMGNPAPALLVPACAVASAETMGEGRHLRLQARAGGARCGAVAFGAGGRLEELRGAGRIDLVCRLELDEWRGSVAPRLVVRAAGPVVPDGSGLETLSAGAPPRLRAVTGPGPRRHDRRGAEAAVATALRLAASGEPTVLVVDDVEARAVALAGPFDPARLGGDLVVADHAALASAEELHRRLRHVVVLDPPATFGDEACLATLPPTVEVHLVYGEREVAFVRRRRGGGDPRELLAALWRSASPGTALDERAWLARVEWPDGHPPAEVARRLPLVLEELGLADRSEGTIIVTAPGSRVDLAASPTYQALAAQAVEIEAVLGRALEPAEIPADEQLATPA
jgi:single-stranded-DNA-specific exonuclease